MMVIGLITTLTAMAVPALQTIQCAGNMTRAAYEIAGVLENARTYAMANRTFVWVGFYEEDASQSSPAPKGTGRIILSVVASKDGTSIYNPGSKANPDPLDSKRLVQLGKLTKIENAHLALLPVGTGSGGAGLAGRPAVHSMYGRFGEINADTGSRPATDSKFPFVYPLAGDSAQYSFSKIIQFTPRGEAVVNSTYSLRPVLEIGLQSTHGSVVDAENPNVAAVQLSGILGQVNVYRQ